LIGCEKYGTSKSSVEKKKRNMDTYTDVLIDSAYKMKIRIPEVKYRNSE